MSKRGGDGMIVAMGRLLRSGTAAGLSDGQLLERFASRHDEAAEAAFATIVDRHGPMVLGVCRRILGDAHDAQDAFQATFLVLVGRADSLRRVDSLASWLFGVARRVAARTRCAAARRRDVELRAATPGEPFEEPAEDRGEIWDEVGRLPDRLREPVLLCYLEGLTHEQAAARLGWPVGTVRSRLARARDRLRRSLGRKGFEPPREAGGFALLPAVVRPPASLTSATVAAAMKFAAREAFEAGLVPASVVLLTNGALTAMTVTKIQGAVVALVAAGILSAGAFAYQKAGAQPGGADAPPPPHASLTDGKVLAPNVATVYRNSIDRHAKAASRAHESNDLGGAIEHTRAIARLAGEWGSLLSHVEAASRRAAEEAEEVVPPVSVLPPHSRADAAIPRPAADVASQVIVPSTVVSPNPVPPPDVEARTSISLSSLASSTAAESPRMGFAEQLQPLDAGTPVTDLEAIPSRRSPEAVPLRSAGVEVDDDQIARLESQLQQVVQSLRALNRAGVDRGYSSQIRRQSDKSQAPTLTPFISAD